MGKVLEGIGHKPFFTGKDFVLYLENSIDILKKLPENSIDMIFADPPYNLSNGGFTVHAGKRVSVNKGKWDESKGMAEDYAFHLNWLKECYRVLKPEGTIWVSGTYHSIYQCGHALQHLGYKILNDIAWFKPNASPNLSGRYFTASHETLLWARKDHKAKHTFNEDKLIESCVNSINRNLRVSQTMVVITDGYLSTTKQNTPEMKKLIGEQVVLEEIAAKNVTYDLIGEIAGPTKLTRRAAAQILQNIEPAVFKLFSTNPEDFIHEAIKLIDEQKASTIIEHITYNKLDQTWNAEEIFVDATIGGEYGKNVMDAKKHLYDKIRYDSPTIEKPFAEELEIAESVELYVKLPNGFYINTPMGKYNPDWAITFKEGSVKHVYFVAETKGDTSDLQLREVEKAKIECARRHFKKISNGDVVYDAVDSFTDLMNKITHQS